MRDVDKGAEVHGARYDTFELIPTPSGALAAEGVLCHGECKQSVNFAILRAAWNSAMVDGKNVRINKSVEG